MVYRCRAQKPDGKLCKNRVTGPDVRCRFHVGLPAGRVTSPPRPRRPRRTAQRAPARTRRSAPVRAAPRAAAVPRQQRAAPTPPSPERRRLEEVAGFCADTLKDGGAAAIADRASAYVSDATWKALVRKHRRKGCDELAELARAILKGKEQLHDAVAQTAGGLLGLLRRPRIERVFAQELARRIPLPWDAQLAAAARGLQIAGIYVCLVGNRELADCACLADVLKAEGKERVKKLIQAAVEDWRSLPARMSDVVGEA